MGVMISAWQRGAAESRACNECLDVAAIILMRLRRAELIADFPLLAMGFAFHAEEKMAPETGLEPVWKPFSGFSKTPLTCSSMLIVTQTMHRKSASVKGFVRTNAHV